LRNVVCSVGCSSSLMVSFSFLFPFFLCSSMRFMGSSRFGADSKGSHKVLILHCWYSSCLGPFNSPFIYILMMNIVVILLVVSG
jgi:hypothetical protein